MSLKRRSILGSYEQRVRFFLGLLVLVLAAANAANFLLLRSAWQSLHDATEEAVDVRGASAARAVVARASGIAVPEGSAPGALSVAELEKIADEAGVRSVSLLSSEGRVLAASDGSVPGAADPDYSESFSLVPPTTIGLSFRPATHLIDRSGVMVRFQAVADAKGRGSYLVKTIHDTVDLADQRRAYVWLVVMQTAAILVVLVAAAAFGRWIARPYRLIAEEAGSVDLLSGSDDPENLLAALRRVVSKVREQDEELRALHRETDAPVSDLRKFTEGAARGMTSGLIALDAHGAFVAANPAAARILGWTTPPASGDPLEAWAGPETALARLIRASLDGRLSRSREVIQHPSPAGGEKRLHLGVALSPILGEETPEGDRAGASGLLCLIGDLTEIHDLEEMVRRREALAALGTVSAGIAHEVRNALATILGFARLAEKSGGGPRSVEHARAIVKEVEAVGRTVEDFLRYARPSRLHPVPVALRPLVEQVVDEARHAGLLAQTEVEVVGDAGTVIGDEQALRQTFTNLVRNASESAERRVHLRIGLARGADGATITFADDGEGIAPENLDRIFLPFFTTRGSGTGLGLAIAQKTVLDHEGLLEVSCPPGGGTVFRLQLPGRA